MSRLISLPLHSALEIALATAVMAAPFVFGFDAAALVTSVAIGAILMGLALGSSGDQGRGSIPVAAHAAYDSGMALGLMAAGLLFGITGDAAALAVLAGAGVMQLALNLSTRYTAAAGA